MLEPGRAPCCQSLTTPCRVSTSVMRWARGPVSSFMSSWPRAMGLKSSSQAEPGTFGLSHMCASLQCIGGGAPRTMAR